jgi:hypothetical protein
VDSGSLRFNCPACRHEINAALVNVVTPFPCPLCGTPLKAPPLYRGVTATAGLIASLFGAQLLGLKAYYLLAWFPLLILCMATISNFAKAIVPPRLMLAEDISSGRTGPVMRNIRMFVGLWLYLTVFLLVYSLIFWGLASTSGEAAKSESSEMFSLPLAWANRAFLITPDKSFVATVGIVFANCFFYTATLLGLWRFVRSRFRKSAVTQLNITDSPHDEDEGDS